MVQFENDTKLDPESKRIYTVHRISQIFEKEYVYYKKLGDRELIRSSSAVSAVYDGAPRGNYQSKIWISIFKVKKT